MPETKPLKPLDVVVALRLVEVPGEKYEDLAVALGVSPSMAHGAVRRLQDAGLLRPETRAVNRLALREFLEHGVRYAFPAVPGGEVRGVPTGHSAPPLAAHIVAEDGLVWPAAFGSARGRGIAPLYPQAVELPERSPHLYESLALVDAVRAGRVRERALAMEMLADRLAPGDGGDSSEQERRERWVATWREAGPALEAEKRRELERLDTPTALAQLSAAFAQALERAPPRLASGLVEQQRLFRRLVG